MRHGDSIRKFIHLQLQAKSNTKINLGAVLGAWPQRHKSYVRILTQKGVEHALVIMFANTIKRFTLYHQTRFIHSNLFIFLRKRQKPRIHRHNHLNSTLLHCHCHRRRSSKAMSKYRNFLFNFNSNFVCNFRHFINKSFYIILSNFHLFSASFEVDISNFFIEKALFAALCLGVETAAIVMVETQHKVTVGGELDQVQRVVAAAGGQTVAENDRGERDRRQDRVGILDSTDF